MIRRYFLRFLALSPLAALAAPQSARGQIVARAAGPAGAPELLPGRVDLLLRMGRIHATRKMLDVAHLEANAIYDKHHPADVAFASPTFSAEFHSEVDPTYLRIAALELRLEDLERAPLDTLMGDPEVRPGGALWELRTGTFSDGTEWEYIRPGAFAQHVESRHFREDELATFSVVGVSA